MDRQTAIAELLVCWAMPTELPQQGAAILSFLPPSSEEQLEKDQGIVIRAREASRAVRGEAVRLYIDLVAGVGTAPFPGGGTLRGALARDGQASLWWYHPVAFKDCERDPTFQWIIAVLTIKAVAGQFGAKKVVLVEAPWEVAAVLRGPFIVEAIRTCRPPRMWWIWLCGFGSRVLLIVRAWRQWVTLPRWAAISDSSFDVVLSGFWDWSVRWDDRAGSFIDRYFKRLPEELKREGISSIGWFVWLDPYSEPCKPRRQLRDVLAPLKGRKEVAVLQAFLSPRDILRAACNLSPLVTYLRIRGRMPFKKVFVAQGIDYFPLFAARLLSGFLDASLPSFDLMALAMERAARHYRPRLVLSFLEHFPHSRAQYEGLRRSGILSTTCVVQHASYSHEKTFLFLHPSLEFRGEPDGYAVPCPDYVCAMGTLGRELFLECGYPKDRVLLTGSPRYDHVRVSSEPSPPKRRVTAPDRDKTIRLLLVSGLDVEQSMDMLEVVWTAVRGVEGVHLTLRNHPFSRIEQHPRFAPYKDRIELTHASLQADIEEADLILFTYSTVAEEAFLQGKPVWQWLPLGFNGSALAEAVAIPQFGSVTSLRNALQEFRSDPSRMSPGKQARELVLERLFYRGDGGAALRVAVAVGQLLATGLRVQQGRRMQTSGAPSATVAS